MSGREAIFVAANTPLGELFRAVWTKLASIWQRSRPAATTTPPSEAPAAASTATAPAQAESATTQSPALEAAREEEPERPPVLGAFPYLYSVLSRGVLNLLLLPEDLTDDELIELARVQITANQTRGCLLLGPDRCVFFQPDGSATFHPLPPRCWRVETGMLRAPFHLDISEARRELAAGYVAMLHERAGHGWGDRERGGEETTADAAARLRGVNDDGSPRGLERCATCGEHRGWCLDPLRQEQSFILPVYCRCQNVNRCARCGHLLHSRRLDGNYYRPQDGLLIYVPGVAAAKHRCPVAISDDPLVASLPERFWSVN